MQELAEERKRKEESEKEGVSLESDIQKLERATEAECEMLKREREAADE